MLTDFVTVATISRGGAWSSKFGADVTAVLGLLCSNQMNRAQTLGYGFSLLRITLSQCFLVRITSRLERFRFCTWTNPLVHWKDPQWRLVLWMVALTRQVTLLTGESFAT
jgi:hypothetical protein